MLLVFVFLLSLLFGISSLAKASENIVQCHSEFSCSLQNISITNGSIQCYGDHSCSQSSIVIDTTSFESTSSKAYTYNLECHGSYSCFNTTTLSITSRNSTNKSLNINCYGLYSCANSQSISFSIINSIVNSSTPGNTIRCYGESACSNSTIYTTDDTIIYVDTYKGIADSVVISQESGSSIHMSGRLSGQNTLFYCSGSNCKYGFYGTQSGDNSTIFCANYQSCQVWCYGNACNYLNLQCWNISDNSYTKYNAYANYGIKTNINNSCTISVDCEYAEKSEACPYGFDSQVLISTYESSIAFVYSIPSITSVTNDSTIVTTRDNSEGICTNDDENGGINGYSIFCNDYYECSDRGSILRNDTNNGTICCGGRYACANAENIITYAYALSQTDVGIRCDGNNACLSSSILSSTNGNIYKTGRSIDSTSGNTIKCENCDIFCTAAYSCLKSRLINSRTVFCLGQFSCSISNISNITGNVFIGTYYGNSRSIIDNVGGSVFCDGIGSCRATTIKNIDGDVYGNGPQSLWFASIFNVTNSVIVIGKQGLRQGHIVGAKNAICLGRYSCINLEINDVETVIGNGANSLTNATIISGIGKNLTVKINGTQDRLMIDCSSNSNAYCNIICQSIDACEKITVTCDLIMNYSSDSTDDCNYQITNYSDYVASITTMSPTDTKSTTTVTTGIAIATNLSTSTILTPSGITLINTDPASHQPSAEPTGQIAIVTEQPTKQPIEQIDTTTEVGGGINSDSDDDKESIEIIVLVCAIMVLITIAFICFWGVKYFRHKKKTKHKRRLPTFDSGSIAMRQTMNDHNNSDNNANVQKNNCFTDANANGDRKGTGGETGENLDDLAIDQIGVEGKNEYVHHNDEGRELETGQLQGSSNAMRLTVAANYKPIALGSNSESSKILQDVMQIVNGVTPSVESQYVNEADSFSRNEARTFSKELENVWNVENAVMDDILQHMQTKK